MVTMSPVLVDIQIADLLFTFTTNAVAYWFRHRKWGNTCALRLVLWYLCLLWIPLYMYYPPNCSFPIICRIDEEENAKNHYQRSQPILLYVHTSTTSCWMERSLDLLVQNKVPMLPKLELVSSFLLFSRQNAPVTITQLLSSKTNDGIYKCTLLAKTWRFLLNRW